MQRLRRVLLGNVRQASFNRERGVPSGHPLLVWRPVGIVRRFPTRAGRTKAQISVGLWQIRLGSPSRTESPIPARCTSEKAGLFAPHVGHPGKNPLFAGRLIPPREPAMPERFANSSGLGPPSFDAVIRQLWVGFNADTHHTDRAAIRQDDCRAGTYRTGSAGLHLRSRARARRS